MEINGQLITVKEKIVFLLDSYSNLRDDDKKLWVSYLVMFHNLQDVLNRPNPFDALCDLLLTGNVTGIETIRRTRQKIQENSHQKEGSFKKINNKNNKVVFSVKDRIEHLLKNYPALRDNDTQLWLAYLTMFHNLKERLNETSNSYEEFCDIVLDKEVPTMESIRRSRQAFQEIGLYLGEKRKRR